jgi:hypothetical protein
MLRKRSAFTTVYDTWAGHSFDVTANNQKTFDVTANNPRRTASDRSVLGGMYWVCIMNLHRKGEIQTELHLTHLSYLSLIPDTAYNGNKKWEI